MNLPNKLTLARLVLTALFVACMTSGASLGYSLGLAVFALAIATDYFDGMLARKYHLITDFGKLMDPLADKILTASAFICLIPVELAPTWAVPTWAVIAIIAREFLITGLRLLAGSKGVVLPAERLGKHKTAWQMATVTFFLLLLALGEWPGLLPEKALGIAAVWIGPSLIGVTVALTIWSGGAYLWKNRNLIEDK